MTETSDHVPDPTEAGALCLSLDPPIRFRAGGLAAVS